jgi:hypothetical protein
VHIDRSEVAVEGVVPDLLQELLAGEGPMGVLGEGGEEVELLGWQVELLAAGGQGTGR